MPTRKETSYRRQALHEELRLACRNGTLPMGEPLPPVRELAGRYSVSHRIVSDAIRALTDEGLLYTVPRIGTFVGSLGGAREGLYLFLRPDGRDLADPVFRLQNGFEEQISKLGGSCLCLSLEAARQAAALSGLLQASGVFHMTMPSGADLALFSPGCAHAVYREGDIPLESGGESANLDRVFFDNEGAGQQMTQYLVRQGHRRIAYLGLHGEHQTSGPFVWSRQRFAGWHASLASVGQATAGLAYLPERLEEHIYISEQVAIATQVARRLVPAIIAGAVTAVVTVNVHAAQGLFAALQAARLSADRWPVVTTFGMGDANVAMMTSMLLTYEPMGREAADLLWSRSHGNYTGPGRAIAVPMRLITRLTCRPAWKASPEAAVLSAMAGSFA